MAVAVGRKTPVADLRAIDNAGLELLSIKEIRTRDRFSGMKADFEAWAFPFETDVANLGWGELVETAINMKEPISDEALNAVTRGVGMNLYLWLSQRMQGKALGIVSLVKEQNGWEALRLIYAEYRPRGDASDHGMLLAILQPKWWQKPPHNKRPFMDVLMDWERMIAQYELSTKEPVSNGTKCATVMGFGPPEIQKILQGASYDVRHKYAMMHDTIREVMLNITDTTFVPVAPGGAAASASDPMDVSAIGFDRLKCSVCGKPGHSEKACWSNPANKAAKAAGKGDKGKKGDKGGGKGDHRKKDCHWCGKPGHIAKECRDKAAGKPKTAKGGGVHNIEKYSIFTDDEDDDLEGDDHWCMTVAADTDTEDDGSCLVVGADCAKNVDSTFVLLDGGSDDHCARPSFGEGLPLEETDVRLRDAQKTRIPLSGARTVPMAIDGVIPALSKFQIGPFAQNLFSTGKLYDGGLDIVMSQRHGCFVGKGLMNIELDANYKKINMERKGNTYGLRVRTHMTLKEAKASVRSDVPQDLNTFAIGADGRETGLEPAMAEDAGSAPADVNAGLVPATDGAQETGLEPVVIEETRSAPAVPVGGRSGAGDAAVGPESRVDLLKARLKELHEPIWGTKQQLWTRLAKAEAREKARRDELDAAVQRQEARALGQAPADVREVPDVVAPSAVERARHELTHIPFASWCDSCVMGQATEKPHYRQSNPDPAVPMIMFDFAFNAAVNADDNTVDATLGTSVVAVDAQTGVVYGNALGSKEADDFTVKEVNKFIRQMGHRKVDVRCDNEPAPKAIQGKLLALRSAAGEPTVITNGKTKDSQSMGLVETNIRRWRGKLCTLRFDVEAKYGRKLTPSHLLWSWIARHAGQLITKFQPRNDGTTPHFGAFGHSYTGEVLPFCETVHFKAPLSKSRQRKGGTRVLKADTAWAKGLWVGKSDNNDEHIVLTPEGKMTARTVRRLPVEHRYNQEIFDKVIGQPWQDRLLAIRGVARSLPTPSLPATPVPTQKELDTATSVVAGAGHEGVASGSGGARPSGDAMQGVESVPAPPAAGLAPAVSATAVTPQRGEKRERSSTDVDDEMKVNMVSELHEKIDYSSLESLEEIEVFNRTQYDNKEVAEGKAVGLELLDEFGVYGVEPSSAAAGKHKVDTKWEIAMRGGVLKCRLVGREFRFLEERDDVFAPGSTSTTSRVVDYCALKDDDDPDDPLVTFVGDCISAFYQTPEEEEFYVDPPPEWLAVRRARGEDCDVVWRLLKQLPGRRKAGRLWIDHCATQFTEECGLERYDPLPQFFKGPSGTRLLVELHMDDFHGVARKSEAEWFLDKARVVLKLKASDAIISGRYEHLKRTRIKMDTGTLIRPHPKHAQNIIYTLGLENANPAKTPEVEGDRPENSPELTNEKATTFRKCAGHGIYHAIDRTDVQHAVCLLTGALSKPTEYDLKSLIRYARYLKGTPEVGVWMPRVDSRVYRKGVVLLKSCGDSDFAGDRVSRKSISSKACFADGCQLFSQVKRQSLVGTSSGEVEFYAMTDTALETKPVRDLFEWLGFVVDWQLGTDSSAARGMALREGIGKVRHLDTRALWTQHAVKELGMKVVKVDGKENPADLGTKRHSEKDHWRLMNLCGLVRSEIDCHEISVHMIMKQKSLKKATIETSTNSVRSAAIALLGALLAEERNV